MMKKWIVGIAAASVLLSVTNVPAAPAKNSQHLTFGAGFFDVLDKNEYGQFSLEYRGNYLWEGLRPVVGASLDIEGGIYGYGGFNYDIWLGDSWVLSPNLVAGLYENNGSKRLGGPIEFRSGLELDYSFQDDSRLGVTFNHISNAKIYDQNPGAESLMLVYSLPIGF